jgi:acetoin utilization deacetylase AcuC-like enzyme
MKIIYHEKYLPSYDSTPAGDSGRIEPSLALLKEDPANEFLTPEPAAVESIKKAHTDQHIAHIQNYGHGTFTLYETALLGAGGAILAAETAAEGEPAFGLIRPPGHHASSDSCWGFCYFNNIAVSLYHLRERYNLKKGVVLDFDLHVGDGNINILGGDPDYTLFNPGAPTEKEYLSEVESSLSGVEESDIITASTGFDQGITDWGGLLSPGAYFEIGRMMKEFSLRLCQGRRYALLEGGYNFKEMAKAVKAFCEGFRD